MNFTSSHKYHDRRNVRSDQTVLQVRRGWRSNDETVNVTEPELVGYFSLDGNRTYLPDSTNLSYYIPPKTSEVHFDLNRGIESVRRRPASADDEKIENLLKWIRSDRRANPATSLSKPGKIEPNFVCFRGLLTALMCTPYLTKEAWIICASKWKGTIYLCAFKSLEEKQKFANISKDMVKFMSWGYKFEKYMLSDAPDKAPNTSQPVDEAEEFCCMFRRSFGNHTVLYGAEMDGVTAKTQLKDPLPLQDLEFVELKTNRTIENAGQDRNFRKFKLLKWWCQSYLVGIDKVLCGFRDDYGIVHKVETYSLSKMVEMSKSYWDPKCCINFVQDFLSHVSKTVVNDCDKTIYRFDRISLGDIVTTELSTTSDFAFMTPSDLEDTE